MEERNRPPSHLPLFLLAYIPILLYLNHRLNLNTLAFARILSPCITGIYFVIPAVVLVLFFGEMLGLRRFSGLKNFFSQVKPPLSGLIYDLVCFVVLPTVAWCFWR